MRTRMGISIALGGALLLGSAFANPTQDSGTEDIAARKGVHNPFQGKVNERSGPNLNSGNGAFIGGTSVDSDQVNATVIDPAAPWGAEPWKNAMTPREYFDLEKAMQDIRNLLASKKPGEGLSSKDLGKIGNLSYLKKVMTAIHNERLANEGSKDTYDPNEDALATALSRVKLRPYYAYNVATVQDGTGKKHKALVPKKINVVDQNLRGDREINYVNKKETVYKTNYYYVRVYRRAGRCGCRGYWTSQRRSYRTASTRTRKVAASTKLATNQVLGKLQTRVASKTLYKEVKTTTRNKKWVSYFARAGRCGCRGYWTGYWYRWNETKTSKVPYTVKDRVFTVDAPDKQVGSDTANEFIPWNVTPDSDGNVTVSTDEKGEPTFAKEGEITPGYLSGTLAEGMNPKGFN